MNIWQPILFWPKVVLATSRVAFGHQSVFHHEPDWFVAAIACIEIDHGPSPDPDPDSRDHPVLCEMVIQARNELLRRDPITPLTPIDPM